MTGPRLHRYWIELERGSAALPAGAALGCGVTAYDLDDALMLVAATVFRGRAMPAVVRVVDDVDVSALDAGHVRPNMDEPARRGVWFPAGHR